MSSVSENSHDFETVQKLRQSFEEVSRVNRSGRVMLGSALLLSALGLWIVPVSDGDTAMRLIKLLVSLVLFALGAMFISSVSERETPPQFVIDPLNSELQVIHKNRVTGGVVVTTYHFDDLSEVALVDKVLTARDAVGTLVISERIRDKATEAALRASLEIKS